MYMPSRDMGGGAQGGPYGMPPQQMRPGPSRSQMPPMDMSASFFVAQAWGMGLHPDQREYLPQTQHVEPQYYQYQSSAAADTSRLRPPSMALMPTLDGGRGNSSATSSASFSHGPSQRSPAVNLAGVAHTTTHSQQQQQQQHNSNNPSSDDDEISSSTNKRPRGPNS